MERSTKGVILPISVLRRNSSFISPNSSSLRMLLQCEPDSWNIVLRIRADE
jgi:hypothetical protein